MEWLLLLWTFHSGGTLTAYIQPPFNSVWFVFEPAAGKKTNDGECARDMSILAPFKESARGLWRKTGSDVLAETANITKAGS